MPPFTEYPVCRHHASCIMWKPHRKQSPVPHRLVCQAVPASAFMTSTASSALLCVSPALCGLGGPLQCAQCPPPAPSLAFLRCCSQRNLQRWRSRRRRHRWASPARDRLDRSPTRKVCHRLLTPLSIEAWSPLPPTMSWWLDCTSDVIFQVALSSVAEKKPGLARLASTQISESQVMCCLLPETPLMSGFQWWSECLGV